MKGYLDLTRGETPERAMTEDRPSVSLAKLERGADGARKGGGPNDSGEKRKVPGPGERKYRNHRSLGK